MDTRRGAAIDGRDNAKSHKQKVYDTVNSIKYEISFYPAANIAGFDDEEAWKIRDELFEQNPDGVVQGLAGITSERAWGTRESLVEVCPHSVARSLVGLNDERSWQMRERISKLSTKEGSKNGLAESVAFVDDERAWKLRYDLETTCIVNVLESLNGLDSEKAWALREKYKDINPREVVASLIGLDNDKSNEWRKEFLQAGHTDGVILSYMGSNSYEAWELRDQYLEQFTFAVATSLAGLESERSWKMRELIKQKAEKSDDERIYKGLAQSLSPYMSAALKMTAN